MRSIILQRLSSVPHKHIFLKEFVGSRFLSSNSSTNYDIAIVGGGMVGFSMAAALTRNPATRNLKILLLEASPKSQVLKKKQQNVNAPYKNRVVALSPATKKFLTSAGAWQHIEAVRLQCVKHMYVWESHSDAFLSLEKQNNDKTVEDMAYIVENDVVLEALTTATMSSLNSASEVRFDAHVRDVTLPTPDHECNPAVVTFKDGSEVTASLLVAADGFNSLVRKQSPSIDEITWPHDKAAVVATLFIEGGHDPTIAWQRFLPNGPIAYLPLNPHNISLVWSSTKTEAKLLMEISDIDFIHRLNGAMWRPSDTNSVVRVASNLLDRSLDFWMQSQGGAPRPHRIAPTITSVVPGSRAMFPLGFMMAKNFVAPRTALVGDAAHRILPLAGQGVNLGFGDVDCLTRILAEAVSQGADLGSLSHLNRYETERQRFTVPMAATIEGLQALYSFTAPPLVLARTLGLKLCNAIPPVKNVIVSSATEGSLRIFN